MHTATTPIPAPAVPLGATPPQAPLLVRRAALAGLVGIAIYLAIQSILQLSYEHPDFEFFYKAGHWLYEKGGMDRRYDINADGTLQPRGSIEWYLPFVSRLMTLICWLPHQAAGAIWVTINLAAFFTTIRLLGKYFTDLPPRDWPVTQILPVFFLIVCWAWEFRLNQINNLTLLLLVASFVHWRQGRANVAGLWLGLAVLLKLTPAFVAFWFLLKRQYRVVAIAITTFLLAGPVGSLIVFGPEQLLDEYRTWKYEALERGSHRGLVLGGLETDWRNQSVGAVISRWFTSANYNTHFDNDPRLGDNPAPKYLNVADWPRERVLLLTMGFALGSVLFLAWLARRPANRLTRWQLRLEFALFILAMLWLMPVMRRYHIIWALPAMSVLAASVHYLNRHWSGRLALVGMFTMLAAQASLLSKTFFNSYITEAAGSLLFGVFALAIPLVVLLLRLGRDPAAISSQPLPGGELALTASQPAVAPIEPEPRYAT